MPLQCSEISGVDPVFPHAPTVQLWQNTPNPFNPRTNIRFDLPHGQRVSLGVFDLAGRMVRTLVAGEILATGSHAREWNGRDDTGKSVAAGVYFYRLDLGQSSETRSMVLLK
jgi:hypothetical protein